jgi:hypothetical protein
MKRKAEVRHGEGKEEDGNDVNMGRASIVTTMIGVWMGTAILCIMSTSRVDRHIYNDVTHTQPLYN